MYESARRSPLTLLGCGVSGLAYTETCGAFRDNAAANCPTFNTVISAR